MVETVTDYTSTSPRAAAANRMAAAAVAAQRAAVAEGARILVAEPARRDRIVAGLSSLSPAEQRHRVAVLALGERRRLASGHWTASRNRLVALRQLLRALRIERQAAASLSIAAE